MAKVIEQTPVLEDAEASRFLEILDNVKNVELTPHEKEIKRIVENLPDTLKL